MSAENELNIKLWQLIDKYFEDNYYALEAHLLNSYDDFLENGLPNILRETNPMIIYEEEDATNPKKYNYECRLYLGGKNGDKIKYGKPMIYDLDRKGHYMYPNEARLRDMTYALPIFIDIDVDFRYKVNKEETKEEESSDTLEDILLVNMPIMLHSKFCVLNGLPRDVCYEMGECRNDRGGYFIIDGKEKIIVSQEKFANNMVCYKKLKEGDKYIVSADITPKSENASKQSRVNSVRIVAPTSTYKNGQIVVLIPNVKKPIPLFILFRALGVMSDKDIITHCLLDLETNEDFLDEFESSVYDGGIIQTQDNALEYISQFIKGESKHGTYNILMNYFMPHMGELKFKEKALYLGHIVFELLKLKRGDKEPTDRDHFKFKRVELPGTLLYDLFRELYLAMKVRVKREFDAKYGFHVIEYENANFQKLIYNNYQQIFAQTEVKTGIKNAFKGNWGLYSHSKRFGLVQDLDNLSFNSRLNHKRKLILQMDSSAKVVGPRLLHMSQYGYIDPVDTPDGGNVGLHKHMTLVTRVSKGFSMRPMVRWLRTNCNLRFLTEIFIKDLHYFCKIFVNGSWVGVLDEPIKCVELIRSYRQCGLVPLSLSIDWDVHDNVINIYTDSGRLLRPLFYVSQKHKSSFLNLTQKPWNSRNMSELSWIQLVFGIENRKVELGLDSDKFFKVNELYEHNDIKKIKDLQGIVTYLDPSEEENRLIFSATNSQNIAGLSKYTHVEIHPSLMFGVMGNQVTYPESNQLPRNLYSCGQAKQAVGTYHTNYGVRIDKMGLILNNGEIPIVKSRFLKHINNEEHPYGQNVIVAIGCYTGYNVEDALIFNGGSVARGLFRNTYYGMYHAHEEVEIEREVITKSVFKNVNTNEVVKLNPSYDYSYLDEMGVIKENTPLHDKITLIGQTYSSSLKPGYEKDTSVYPKKGQLGFVDKTYVTNDPVGKRIVKIRTREERIPSIGDKFCSRCGQKGTVGLVLEEENMPYTKDGVRPDIIVNPHAFPSRMTIGQLIEVIVGKACSIYGGFGDCTAFVNHHSQHEIFGKLLSAEGYSSTGEEILYDAYTGKQMQAKIYMGVNYYTRLKHMVKDKINHRATGPKVALTRQPLQGRANDGGLRIGEMERDSLLAHGASSFLRESMYERADHYQMAICNKTGGIAIYNESKNLFISPLADGPVQFTNPVDTIQNLDNTRVEKITKHSRDFSIVKVPYCLKLLMHELACMNIKMSIITDQNINQFLNATKKPLALDIAATALEHERGKDVRDLVNQNVENTSRVILSRDSLDEEVIPNINEGDEFMLDGDNNSVIWKFKYLDDETFMVHLETTELEKVSQLNIPGVDIDIEDDVARVVVPYNKLVSVHAGHTPDVPPPVTTPDGPPPGWEPVSPDGPPPGWKPTTPDSPPPNWEPVSPDGPPPGWKPTTPDSPPPGWEPTTPDSPPPGWEPVSPDGPPPGWKPTTPDGPPPSDDASYRLPVGPNIQKVYDNPSGHIIINNNIQPPTYNHERVDDVINTVEESTPTLKSISNDLSSENNQSIIHSKSDSEYVSDESNSGEKKIILS
jgi:DNA-directed RNA polymerase II subunit RPB2